MSNYKIGESLNREEIQKYCKGYCPDCGIGKFLEGPSGCGSVNVKCDNPECGHCFNDGLPLGVERIEDSGYYKPGRYLYDYSKLNKEKDEIVIAKVCPFFKSHCLKDRCGVWNNLYDKCGLSRCD